MKETEFNRKKNDRNILVGRNTCQVIKLRIFANYDNQTKQVVTGVTWAEKLATKFLKIVIVCQIVVVCKLFIASDEIFLA